MKPLAGCLAVFSMIALGSGPAARGEVYADVSPDGSVATRIDAPAGRDSQVWRPTGAAPAWAYVLNPDGDGRGDGRPDVASSPLTHLPRAVWAQRRGSNFDIATSVFDGRSWSTPTLIHLPNDFDDLDPRIAFRADGVAVVTWWQKSASPVVRLAFATPGGRWVDAGVVSPEGVRARRPEIRQEGTLTILAFRTARNIGIVTMNIVLPEFGDGPTPFPRDGGNPSGEDGSPPSP